MTSKSKLRHCGHSPSTTFRAAYCQPNTNINCLIRRGAEASIPLFFFFLSIVDLQRGHFCRTAKWLSYTYLHILCHILFHSGLSQDIEKRYIQHTAGPLQTTGPCDVSILHLISFSLFKFCLDLPWLPVSFLLWGNNLENTESEHTSIYTAQIHIHIDISYGLPLMRGRRCWYLVLLKSGFLGSSVGKESACNAGDPSLIPGLERSREGIGYPLQYSWASPVTQLVKNLAAMRET